MPVFCVRAETVRSERGDWVSESPVNEIHVTVSASDFDSTVRGPIFQPEKRLRIPETPTKEGALIVRIPSVFHVICFVSDTNGLAGAAGNADKSTGERAVNDEVRTA